VQQLLPLTLQRVSGVQRIDPDFTEQIGRGGQCRSAGQAAIERGRFVEQIGEARSAGFDMHLVPTEFALDRSQTIELGAHLLDLFWAEDVLDDEIAVLIELPPLLGRKIGDRYAELRKRRFCVHWRDPPG